MARKPPGGSAWLADAERRVRRARKRARNYAAEYQRRVAQGAAKGLSRRQARGHSGLAASTSATSQARLEAAAAAFRSSKSHAIETAAKEAGVAPERLREHLRRSGTAQKVGGKWLPAISFYAEGDLQSLVIPDRAERKLIGRYMSEVAKFARTGAAAGLAEFDRMIVTDSSGVGWELETDPRVLRALFHRPGIEVLESIYEPA